MPPRLARQLLFRILPASLRRPVLDDLDGRYAQVAATCGESLARRWYWSQVLRSIPHAILGRRGGRHPEASPLAADKGAPMSSLLQDARFALRLLTKEKAFTVTALVTLALCIGANTAIFSVLNSVVLRPLPVPESDRIVIMENLYPGAGALDRGNSGVVDYYDRKRETDVFEELALYDFTGAAIERDSISERVRAGEATPSLFRLLRTRPHAGRLFTEAASEVGGDDEVVLAYEAWQQLYAGQASAIGDVLRVDGRPHEIVGVLPPDFHFVHRDIALWTPRAFTDEERSDDNRHNNSWSLIGRLRDGASLAQGQEQIDALNARNIERFPAMGELLVQAGFHTRVSPLQDYLVRDVRPMLYLLWGGVLCVLLIGCVNLANLSLVRTTARMRELATRFAVGAERVRVVRQILTESLLLTLLGGLAGAATGWLALQGLTRVGMQELPRGTEIALDGTALLATLATAMVVGLFVGAIPVIAVARMELTTVFRENGRTGTSGTATQRLRKGLVVAQVALAFMLLIGAGLLLASFLAVLRADPGFRADGIWTASVSLRSSPAYDGGDARRALVDGLYEGLGSLPGVRGVSLTTSVPLGGSYSDSVILAEDHVPEPDESVKSFSRIVVGPGYFDALEIPVLRGRTFDGRDRADAAPVIVVDERLATHFWGDENPVGKRMFLPINMDNLFDTTDAIMLEIVGVVADAKLHSLEDDLLPGTYYFPYAQSPASGFQIVIKAEGDPAALVDPVRAEIAALDPSLPLFNVTTLEQLVERSLVTRRSPMMLTLAFGAVALFLAALGIYGVLAYLVAQRTREIGIRMALGGAQQSIFQLVLGEGVLIVAIGLVLGVVGAVALRRTLESQLYGVGAMDPLVLAAAVITLAFAAMAACALPAIRATRIDPVVALAAD